MIIKSAEVFLWGTRVGVVSCLENDIFVSFRYDDNFIKSKIEISPIVMPLSSQIYRFPSLNIESFKGLPGMLADSLPDYFGDAIINAWMNENGYSKTSMGAIDRLCYTGKRGMGALEYKPISGPKYDKKEKIDIGKMVKLASNVLSNREKLHSDVEDATMLSLLKFGTSAGGARAKAIVAWNEKTKDICSGQIKKGDGYSYWIIKFDEVSNNGDHGERDFVGYTNVEYAYSLMAKDAQINMMDCRLLKDDFGNHFMTKRFDREKETNDKIHSQTLGAIAHFDYKKPGECSYEKAAEVCRRLKLGQNDIEELYRRMVFNVVSANCDDHVKNISFLMDRNGKWSLSPAYDLCFSYSPNSPWVSQHQMTINGKRTNILMDDILSCAESMNIKKSKSKEIASQVIKIVSNWSIYAEKAGVSKPLVERINNIVLSNNLFDVK